jgi:hypothetical protein
MKNMGQKGDELLEKTDLDKVSDEVIDKSKPSQIQGMKNRVGDRIQTLKKGMLPNSGKPTKRTK